MTAVMNASLSRIVIRHRSELVRFVVVSAVDRLRLLMIINLLRLLSGNQWRCRRLSLGRVRDVRIAHSTVTVLNM